MKETLTFRERMNQWLSSKTVEWAFVLAFIGITIWKDNIAYFLGIVFVLLLLWSKKWDWKIIGLIKPQSWKKVWVQAISLSIIILVVIDIVFTPFLELLFEERVDLSALDGLRGNLLSYIIFLVFMWIFAAFGEEFVYRGLLVNRLGLLLGDKKSSLWIAVIASSLLFGIAHKYQGIMGMISTFTVGLIFGVIFIKSKNKLWLTILTHGVYDVIGITLIYLDRDKEIYGLLKNLILN
jgi:hypothetical protein